MSQRRKRSQQQQRSTNNDIKFQKKPVQLNYFGALDLTSRYKLYTNLLHSKKQLLDELAYPFERIYALLAAKVRYLVWLSENHISQQQKRMNWYKHLEKLYLDAVKERKEFEKKYPKITKPLYDQVEKMSPKQIEDVISSYSLQDEFTNWRSDIEKKIEWQRKHAPTTQRRRATSRSVWKPKSQLVSAKYQRKSQLFNKVQRQGPGAAQGLYTKIHFSGKQMLLLEYVLKEFQNIYGIKSSFCHVGSGYLLQIKMKKQESVWVPTTLFDPKEAVKIWDIIRECKAQHKRFIFAMLGMSRYDSRGRDIGGHANALILDLQKKTVVRFEPYGGLQGYVVYDVNQLDKFVKNFFLNSSKNQTYHYFRKYVPPLEFCMIPGPQLFEEWDYEHKNFMESGGFCFVFSIWFLELVLLNPQKTYNEITDYMVSNRNNTRVSTKIRLYANRLLKYVDKHPEIKQLQRSRQNG